MGLDNSRHLYKLLGEPLKQIPIIHVGGTNGKGTVCFKISEGLRHSSIKTGLFVSPHISSFRERVCINGTAITEQDVLEHLPYILRLCEKHKISASFFEIATALAFHQFGQSKCEAVVLEVGLGGLLDATNVVDPELSIISSVQLDHMKILGSTVEEIAVVKSGIMKPGVDVLVGPHAPHDVLQKVANRVGARFHTVEDVLAASERSYSSTVSGSSVHDLNSDLARAAFKLLQSNKHLTDRRGVFSRLSPEGIITGLTQMPPCRFEVMKQKWITRPNVEVEVDVVLDIAHNFDAIKSLVSKVKMTYPIESSIRIVVGFCADKDISKSVEQLLQLVGPSSIHCVSASHPRAIDKEKLKEIVVQLAGSSQTPTTSSISDGIKAAVTLVAIEPTSAPRVVLVCGSAFIMSEARKQLGIKEPRDGDILAEVENCGRDSQEYFRN